MSKLYTKIIYDICAFDFSKDWPNFVENCVEKLKNSADEKEIYGSLLALL